MQLVLDCEASGATRNKAHPFDPRNKLCMVGYKWRKFAPEVLEIEYAEEPYGGSLQYLANELLAHTELLIGVNLKYDLHWLRRYNVLLPSNLKVWDCQIAHFLLSHQREKYPSMDDISRKYGLPVKPPLAEKYWDQGIDTDQIPYEELTEYQLHDVNTTYEIYQRQVPEIMAAGMISLMKLCCQDLLVLQEMEFNGMKYNQELSNEKAKQLEEQASKITDELTEVYGKAINWESSDQLSLVLYGGKRKAKNRIPVGVYQTGEKAGSPRYKVDHYEELFDRLISPSEGSALKKPGYYSTDEATLLELKAKGKAKQIIELVLELSKLNKLVGTYFRGIPEKFIEFGWEDDTIHHNLNQCVAVTGRLSSTNPNLQNQAPVVKECFESRF